MTDLMKYKSADEIGDASSMQYHEAETAKQRAEDRAAHRFLLASPGRHYAGFPKSYQTPDLAMFEVVAWKSDGDVLFPMVCRGGILTNAATMTGYGGLFVFEGDEFTRLDESKGTAKVDLAGKALVDD